MWADGTQEGAALPEKRPLSSLEFEVSRVVERLEAGAGAGAAGNTHDETEDPSRPQRKISTGFFEPKESSIEEILNSVEVLIKKTDLNSENDDTPALPPINRLVKASVLSHSIIAYLGVLERGHLSKVNAHITTETTRWITHMFRFFDYNAYYHYDHLEGLVKVTRMMLHYKYPRYLEDGALALTNKLPSIYSSVASPLGVVQHLCRQLGLPLACIRPVPVNSLFGSNQTMDLAALQKLIQEDADSNCRTPLMVLAEAGTTTLGHSDSIARLMELCKQHDVWLHLRGHTLAALAIVPPAPPGLSPKIADSVTLTLGTWFGIPALPVVTLYRLPEPPVVNDHTRSMSTVSSTREGTLPLLAGLAGSDHQARRLPALPLWCAVKAASHAALARKLTSAFHSCALLHQALQNMTPLRILSKPPGGEGGAISVQDLTTKPINVNLLLEVVVPCVVFQFVPSARDGVAQGRVPAYYDKLNSWLGQILQREVSQIMIEICETEQYGAVLRYCPLECWCENWSCEPLTPEQLARTEACLSEQLEILLATVSLKETFATMVQESPLLRLVDIPGWAGLGGVRYVPVGWESLLKERSQEELNILNRSLVEALRNTDSAFSCGEGVDGMACVRFGMVTADTDVEELLSLVISVGREVEENSKVLDTMTEIVKKGIEYAQAELERESTERLWQEGVLRRVPVVGRVVDWWSPPAALGLRGRCLHLSQGTVESTENIYKYHMQIPAGTVPHGVSKAPPPAELQTAVGPPVPSAGQPTHSRSSSHASHASHTSQTHARPDRQEAKEQT